MRLILSPFFWLGRVVLWVVFFPLGIWRSVRHTRKKDIRKQEALTREQMAIERERNALMREQLRRGDGG